MKPMGSLQRVPRYDVDHSEGLAIHLMSCVRGVRYDHTSY